MAPILYYTDESPPCRAVVMLADLIGLTLDIHYIKLDKGEHLTPEFLKMNPQHTIPTLHDDGFILTDSHAINVYLISKYAKDDSLYPKDIKKRAKIDERLHFDGAIAFSLVLRMVKPLRMKQIDHIPENLIYELRGIYDIVEAFLEGNAWICGDSMSLADIHFAATLSSMNLFEPFTKNHPNITKWLNNCSEESWYAINKKGLDSSSEMLSALLST